MIDMRFIRKNIFLVGFVGVSVLCVLVLLVLSVLQYFEMSASIEETDKLREQNEKLIRRRIPANPDNIDRVQQNVSGYTAQEQLHSIYYGQPLYPALKAFCDKLKTTPEALRENFKHFYNDKGYKDSEARGDTIYVEFRDSLGRGANKQHQAIWNYEENIEDIKGLDKLPLWEEALDIFKDKAQLTTVEKLEERDVKEILLSSLGLPRNMDNDADIVLSFRREMLEKISAMYENKDEELYIDKLGVSFFRQSPVPAVKTENDFTDSTNKKDAEKNNSGSNSSSGSENAEKTVGDKTDEIRHWDIVCDLSRRIVDAKVATLEEISYSNLAGKEDGNCRIYTYTLSVTGKEESVRKLLNNLHAAYKDHRVYVVRNLSLQKKEDQIQDIIDFEEGRIGNTSQVNNKLTTSDDVNFAGGSSDNKNAVEDEFFKEKHTEKECIAGRSGMVSATMVLDYVVYNVNVK